MNVMSRLIAVAILLFAIAGCSSVKSAKDSVVGWVNGGDDTLSTQNLKKPSTQSNSPLLKYGATLRVNKYVDQRKVDDPKFLGTATGRVGGVSGDRLILDQEIAAAVTTAIRQRFDAEGFQVLDGSAAANALFEVTGVVKELTLNVKNRDEISIAIETTLKDLQTGETVWSGLVTEKNDRFAGVSGNNKDDVVAYFNRELKIVSVKTVEAVSASLMAAKPELFNLTPGTKAIPGVTVYTAPKAAAQTVTTVTPERTSQPVSAGATAPVSSYVPHASATSGLLLVNTNPPRAKVYLDGVYYVLSPLRLEMEPGVHAISVKLEGYRMVTEKVSVRKGDNTEMELNLER